MKFKKYALQTQTTLETKKIFNLIEILKEKSKNESDSSWSYLLGLLYMNGACGAIKDISEAEKWFRISAEAGNSIAQFQLGRMFQDGIGVIENLIEAKKWLQKAADSGCEVAKYRLERL